MRKKPNEFSIDSVDEMDFANIFEVKDPEETESITFWIPKQYKKKYDALQEKSRRKYGKLLKEVICRSIEKVNIENEAS